VPTGCSAAAAAAVRAANSDGHGDGRERDAPAPTAERAGAAAAPTAPEAPQPEPGQEDNQDPDGHLGKGSFRTPQQWGEASEAWENFVEATEVLATLGGDELDPDDLPPAGDPKKVAWTMKRFLRHGEPRAPEKMHHYWAALGDVVRMLMEEGAADADGRKVLHLAQTYTDYGYAPFEVLATDGQTYGLTAGPLVYIRAARGAHFPNPKLAEDGTLPIEPMQQNASWSTEKRSGRYGGGSGSNTKASTGWSSGGYGGYGNYLGGGGGGMSYGGSRSSSGGVPKGTPPARSDADPWATWNGRA
jgi:hypothetical protein